MVHTEKNLEIAASKAGMDPKTARKYRRVGRMPSELAAAGRWRTRPDPFVEVWDEVLKLFRGCTYAGVLHTHIAPIKRATPGWLPDLWQGNVPKCGYNTRREIIFSEEYIHVARP